MDRTETIGLNELVSLLTTNNKEITREDAEHLLKEWIAVIADVMAEKRPLEVDDFGIFSFSQIRAKETAASIAAGDEQVPCFYKVDFTPHETLRKSVNSFFSHFEPSVLNEGVTFEHIPEVVEGATDEAVSDLNIIESVVVTPPAENTTNPLSESLRQLTPTSRNAYRPPAHRTEKMRKRKKRTSIWIPIVGGAAIILVGLFFFNRTER